MEFWRTMMGKKFFEGHMPRLVSSLEKVATIMEKQTQIMENSMMGSGMMGSDLGCLDFGDSCVFPVSTDTTSIDDGVAARLFLEDDYVAVLESRVDEPALTHRLLVYLDSQEEPLKLMPRLVQVDEDLGCYTEHPEYIDAEINAVNHALGSLQEYLEDLMILKNKMTTK